MKASKHYICRDALEHYGAENQLAKCIEDNAELMVALAKWREGGCVKADVITEIADVMIMAEQMAIYFGREEVEREVERKLVRLEERMNSEYERDE